MLRVAQQLTSWQSKKVISSDVELARHNVFLALQRAMMARAMLEVRLQGDDRLYQSLILELDSDEGTILIDELFPSTYEAFAGQWLNINIRQRHGRSLNFDVQVLQRHLYDGAPIYVVTLPEELDQEQRRASFRLPIDSGIVVESHFVGPDQCHHQGQLRNLSSGGLCLITNKEDDLALACDDVLQDLVFEYEGVAVECEARVKNVVTEIETHNAIQIGAQFQRLSNSERRQLDNLILRMQRQYLRNRDDSERLFH